MWGGGGGLVRPLVAWGSDDPPSGQAGAPGRETARAVFTADGPNHGPDSTPAERRLM